MDVKKLQSGLSFVDSSFSRVYPQFCIDGRFVVYGCAKQTQIVDLFHTSKHQVSTQLNLPLEQESKRTIAKTFFLDLKTVLVIFTETTSEIYKNVCYLGLGKNDMQKITIESEIPVDQIILFCELIGQAAESNLRDGVYASFYNCHDHRCYFFNIKIDEKDQLCLSQPMKSPIGMKEFGLFDGHMYGFFNRNDTNVVDLSNVVKISVQDGAQELLPTKNSTMLFKDGCELDLKSLEWEKTELEVDGKTQTLKSDGKRTLIVVTREMGYGLKSLLYRFIVEQPDSLWNLVSMAVKRKSDLDSGYRSSTVAPNVCPRQCNVKCADWCIDRGSGGGICDVHSHCRCLCTYFSPNHPAYSGYVYKD
ncbi:hypothetical protein M3Y96_00411700 [Aphelenchoides besseyi]|nr:hypothetical protein M3Y96_00411700 [Aphelenchoides besseyi]